MMVIFFLFFCLVSHQSVTCFDHWNRMNRIIACFWWIIIIIIVSWLLFLKNILLFMVPKNFSVVFILIVQWWQLKGYYYNEESGHQTNKNKKTTEQQRIWFEFEWVMGDESKKNNRLSNDSFDFCVVFSSKNKNRRISNFVFIKDSCFQIRKKWKMKDWFYFKHPNHT